MDEFIKKLIERLEEVQEYYSFDFDNSWDCAKYQAYGNAIEIVNQLAEEYNNGWIPCSERTPNDRDAVLVCATGSEEGVFISYYVEELERWRYDTDEGVSHYVNVIAWQPLPAPYEQGK